MRLPHHDRLIAGPATRGPGPARFSRSFIPGLLACSLIIARPAWAQEAEPDTAVLWTADERSWASRRRRNS